MLFKFALVLIAVAMVLWGALALWAAFGHLFQALLNGLL